MKNNVNLDGKFESTLQNMLFIITMIKLLFRLSTFSQKKNGKNFYIKLIFLVLITFVFVRSMTHCCGYEFKNIMVFIMCILKVIRTCEEQYDFYLYGIKLNKIK